jgi:hypothetical protein
MQVEQKILESFTRARYAAWAGDIDHCRELLGEIERKSKTLTEPSYHGSYGLIVRAADQLSERLNSPVEEIDVQRLRINRRQLITTTHLRAVVHRTADFEFEVRAYLDDLSWEESLYARAIAIETERGGRLETRTQKEGNSPIESFKPLRRPATSWRIVENQLAFDIVVGPFCLIIMRGTWTSAEPPLDIDQVRTTFEKALNEIDSDVQVPNHVDTDVLERE